MSCPDCFQGGKATGSPKGTIQSLHSIPTYIASLPSTPTSHSTIVYFTDAFGLDLVNNKLLADAYAAATGLRVLVPDIIPGGPMPVSVMDTTSKAMEPVPFYNIVGQLKRIVNVLSLLSHVVPFMYRARPSSKSVFASCLEYTRKVKADLPPGAKLGVAGFCWGGYLSVNLGAQPAVEGGAERLVDAAFAAHPSFLKLPGDIVDSVTTFKTPLAIAHADEDLMLKTATVNEAEALLRQRVCAGQGENGCHYQIKTYEGVGHGFAVRPKSGSEAEAKAADEALQQGAEWFKKWL